MGADSHSKMGVGKKIRKMFSFRKKDDKPAIEHSTTVEKANTLNGSKVKSSSMSSLRRKFSFGKKDKDKTGRKTTTTIVPAAAAAAAAGETTLPSTMVVPPTPGTEVILDSPKIVADIVTMETRKSETAPKSLSERATDNHDDDDVAAALVEQPTSNGGDELPTLKLEHVSVEENHESDDSIQSDMVNEAAAAAAGADVSVSVSASVVANGGNCAPKQLSQSSPASFDDEPKTITEVINKIHDKTETKQAGANEFVRTVEVEQERTLAEDGTTVISRSTKTTTTTAGRDSTGSDVNQVKTEIKNEVLARVCNGQSKQLSQHSKLRSPNYSFLLAFGLVLAAFACAVVFKYKDFGALLAL